VRAPADGVELTIERVSCELEVLSAGRPLPGASVWLRSGQRGGGIELNDEHRVWIEFGADERVELHVQAPEHAPRTLELTRESIPADGVLRVVLEPGVDSSALPLVPVGAASEALEDGFMGVSLRRLAEGEALRERARYFGIQLGQPRDWLGWSETVRPAGLELTRGGLELRVAGVPPGRYQITVGPMPAPDVALAPLLQELELELAPGDDRRIEWPVELGVLPRITIQGEPSRPLTRAALLGPDGQLARPGWFCPGTSPGSFALRPQPAPDGRSVARGALPPGSYRLELYRDAAPVHVHPFGLTPDGSAEVVVDVSEL
jgi:hypothetical protein